MIKLLRVLTTEFGTLGILFKEQHPFCWTLEDNKKKLAEGDYDIVRKGNQLEIVANGEIAFFTCGSTKDDADGNILLGFKVYSPRFLAESSKAMEEFQKAVKDIKNGVLSIRSIG